MTIASAVPLEENSHDTPKLAPLSEEVPRSVLEEVGGSEARERTHAKRPITLRSVVDNVKANRKIGRT